MLPKPGYLLFIVLLLGKTVAAQYIEKVWTDKTDSVYGYYTIIKPADNLIQGALVLLDGYGGNADGLYTETKLHNIAWTNNILTIGIPTGPRLYADKSIIEYLNKVLEKIVAQFGLRKDQFAIGGMSSGGSIAVRYAELCHEQPAAYPVLPAAVFDVDSPLDLIGLYHSSEREIKKGFKGWWLGESQMILDRCNKELGDINTNQQQYHTVSAYSYDISGAGNEKYLKEVAVRSYHDVDIAWQIQNRRRSFYETNMLNASAFINELVLMGNSRASFVAATVPGRRSNGNRHPHSWNIVDEIDCIQWIKEQLHFYPDHINPAFSLTAPEQWAPETIVFPIDFAAALPYKGFETLRFAPGWGDASSSEKWAYTLLWWLDDSYPFNENILRQNLETYFSGLTRRRTLADKLDIKSWTPARAQVQKTKTMAGDQATYTATINIFDAQTTRQPGLLYLKIHLKDCPQKTKTLLLFEVAGNPYTSAIWLQLDAINTQFSCGK